MTTVASQRLRAPLTPPQAVRDTSVVLWEPSRDTGRVGVVLAPGAGTDLCNAILLAVGRGLAQRGSPVAVFNFGYTEAGRQRPDPGGRLEQAFRDVVAFIRERLGPDRPLVLGGRSMGGRIASQLAAQGEPCAGLVFLGYPLHPRQPSPGGVPAPVPADRLRTRHWPRIDVPTLFIQGDRDRLCKLDLLRREQERHLHPTRSALHVVTGADHGFAVRKGNGRTPADVLDEVVRTAGDWMAERQPLHQSST